jgi:hypothetical protein
MTDGTPVNRNFVVMLRNGIPAIDWGGGVFQDILSGDFLHCAEMDVDHTILDDELDQLMLTSHIYSYNAQTIYLYSLPEPPRQAIE